MGALYMAVIPLINGFNFSALFVIPLIVSIIATTVSIFLRRFEGPRLSWFEGWLSLFVLIVMLSTALNVAGENEKTTNHFLAILATFGLFYYAAIGFCGKAGDRSLLRGLWIGYIAVTGFGIVEFLFRNTANFDIGTTIPRPLALEYAPTFLGGLVRARSTFEESGHFAAYIMISAPLLFYYHWQLRPSALGKIFFVLLTAAALLSAFSVSAFLFGPAALILAQGVRLIQSGRLRVSWLILGAIVAAALLLSGIFSEIFNEVFLRKFTGASFMDRSAKFQETIDVMAASSLVRFLLGYGPGSYFELGINPAISVYINFFRDFGLLGLFFFAVPFLYAPFKAGKIKDPSGGAILVGCLLVVMYFAALPNYFHPYFYVPFIFLKRASAVKPARRSPVKRYAHVG